MPLRLLIMVCLCSAPSCGFPAESPPDLAAHIERLLVELAGSNEALRMPGSELKELPIEALPLLHTVQQRPNLEWPQRIAVDNAVGLLEARSQGKEIAADKIPYIEELNDRMAGRYRRIGKRDARWDDLVERAFVLIAKQWALDPRREGNEIDTALQLLEQAVAAGCNDPYALYLTARVHQLQEDGRATEVDWLMTRAANGIVGSGYHPEDKVYVLCRATLLTMMRWHWKPTGLALASVQRWLDAIPGLVIEAAGMPMTLPSNLLSVIDDYLGILGQWTGDREPGYRTLIAQLDKALPHSAIPRLVEAKFTLSWAWDARGSGWANSVTDQGWKLMAERMRLCRNALEVAGQLDPKLPDIECQWLTCANGLDMDKTAVMAHLTRAIAQKQLAQDALRAAEDSLQPKWGGSSEALLKLGHQCLATGDFEDQIPSVLLMVHRSLSEDSDGDSRRPDSPAYFRQPQVWSDVQALFEGALKRRPHDLQMRSDYVYYAYISRHLDLARAQHALLEGHPCFASFQGRKRYEEIKADLQTIKAP